MHILNIRRALPISLTMMLGLGLGTPLGIVAALLHCLNHGLFKGGLFLGAGSVQQATGTYTPPTAGWYSTRADFVGNPNVDNAGITQWFRSSNDSLQTY